MKVSVIVTVLNESNSIEALLESFLKQTKMPDEIIIVDAGSKDKTVEKIKKFKNTHKLPIRLFIKPKINRSTARNFAIKKANQEIIAVTDAGCILGSHWLERITAPLIEDKADSVAGYYVPITPTAFQKALAPFVAVMPENFDPEEYLPSSRSVAFTKRAWELAGHYPVKLNYCEDLVFAMHLKKNTRMHVEKTAIVYWNQKTSYIEFFRQITNYARGDIEAGYQPHVIKIASVYLRYLAFMIYPPFFFCYLVWAIYKHRKVVQDKACFIYLPALQVTSDIAILWGSFLGLSSKKILQFR